MSEDRDRAGSPVEQAETTENQVLAAVGRAAEATTPIVSGEAPAATETPDETEVLTPTTMASERPMIAAASELPNAGAPETAEEIFAAHPGYPNSSATAAAASGRVVDSVVPSGVSGEALATSETAKGEPSESEQLAAVLSSERDGEIRISSDHPMAALYMQTPMAPDIKGNRGGGVLIALLSAVAFALVYAGVLALWIAPNYPPSTFLNEGLLPWILNWGFAAAVLGYFVGLALLVVIVGRAGWWAYALGGLFVAIVAWAITLLGFALDANLSGGNATWKPLQLLEEFGLFFPVLAAAIVAREVSVWFGAWIGARGRKMKRQNAEAIAEYETALAEVQAKTL